MPNFAPAHRLQAVASHASGRLPGAILLVFALGAGCLTSFPDGESPSAALLLLSEETSTTPTTSASSASPVSSIQTANVSLAAMATQNIAISTVDLSKTVVFCSYRSAQSLPWFLPHCVLTSATNLQVSNVNCCTNVQVVYHVVEFASGASVQRGTQTVPGGNLNQNIGISAVDTAKSFAIIQSRSSDNVTTIDEQLTFTADINGSTNLLLTRNESGATVDVSWQVVQLDGASVQSGTTSISGVTSASPAISTVDPSKSFLLLSVRGAAANNGNDALHSVRGRLSSSSIAFNRGAATNSVDVHYYVVQMDGSTAVQHGTETTPSTATMILTGSPASSFDLSRSFPIVNASINAASEDREQSDFTAELSGSQITMTRNNTAVHASVDWQIIELSQ